MEAKVILKYLVEDLYDYYKDIGVPYEIITSFQKAAELVGHKKAIKFVYGWDE